MTTNRDITDALEQFAPLSYQEQWDNSGYQTGDPGATCTGVLLCVDVTEQIVAEAKAKDCNLIISHHPLIFRGVKQILGRNRVERTIRRAIIDEVTVYSCHTAVDNAPGGVSWQMARMLGLTDMSLLAPSRPESAIGCGVVGCLPAPLDAMSLVSKVKSTFSSPVARCSELPEAPISRVALCGGSGAEFIDDAISLGAQAYINSDTKLNHFLDHVGDIFIIDIGHYESEACTKRIFYHVLSEKFPNFAIQYSEIEKNPINYL